MKTEKESTHMTTPEAKAAEEILCHQLKDQHYSTATAKAIIAKANAEHYLPLLRKVSVSIKVSHGGDCVCFVCVVNREISRLESSTKEGK